MSAKRLRVFAGPNGSGKSTFIHRVLKTPPASNFKLGVYVNADDIEKELRSKKSLSLKPFGLTLTTEELQEHFKQSTFSPVKLNKPELWKLAEVKRQRIYFKKTLTINSYIAADLAELIRNCLLKSGISFSFETVMSDAGKITFLEEARKKGYRVYLYFFATEDPKINISRVNVRVKQKGHFVEPETIKKRYKKSLANLKSAIKCTNRAYLFDTSGKVSQLSCEVTEGERAELIDPENIPNWLIKYLIER